MRQWVFLLGAIIFEVIATTNLKLSDGFTKLVPSILVVLFYSLSFWAVALAMRTLPLGIVYPVWAGLGTALVVATGILAFHEAMTPLKVFGALVVIAGIVILNMSGAHRFE